MEKSGQELKPEWLKSSGFSSGNAGLSNHPSTSPRADGNGKGFPSRSRLAEVDRERSLSSNSRKSPSLNGSRAHNRDSFGKSRAYSSFGSFGRSSREKERSRDFELYDRDGRVHSVKNGYHDPLDLFPPVLDGDKLRRSRSMVSERASETWHKGLGNSLNNGAVSRRTVNGVSFEREFPSLGVEEKSVHAEGGRVASPPGLSPTIQSICKAPVAIGGVGNWNSKLVELPVTPETNGTDSSSASKAASVRKSPAILTSTTGLNMAETIAQAPSRSHTPPQSSIDIQKIEEQTLRQARQLIPLTPTMSKSSVFNSLDKMKTRGGRADSGAISKTGHQLCPQPVSPVRAPVRSEIRKATQLGTFQILNREKNGITSTVKDAAIISNVVSPVVLAPSAASCHMRNPANQKGKTGIKGVVVSTTQGSFGENKLHLQAKYKHEFFNQLRNKSSNSSIVNHQGCAPSSSTTGDSVELNCFRGCHGKDDISNPEPKFSEENLPDASGDTAGPLLLDEEVDPCAGPVDPEEEAFLRSLGWDQNAVVSLLTEEEIRDFNAKYQEKKENKA